MAYRNQKRRISKRAVEIIFCIVMYVLLVLFTAGLFIVSADYGKLYKSPAVISGRVDFTGVELPSRDVACNLAGEWEFFYNKWIITDSYEGEPDGMLKLPGVWTYKNYGSGALPKTGYASYRLIAENIPSGLSISVYRHNGNFAYRVFINGQLNVQSGVLSENADETEVSGTFDKKIPYVADGGPLEIVIELSATRSGGLNAAPWLSADKSGVAYGSSLRSFTYVVLGIASAAVVIAILTFIFFRYKRDYTVPALMIALFMHFLSSKDMLTVIPFTLTYAMIVSLASAIVAFILLIMHFCKNGVKLNKLHVLITAGCALLFTVLLFVFYGTPLAPLFGFGLLITGSTYIVPLATKSKFNLLQLLIYGTLFEFLTSVFCFELCDWLGLLVFGTEFIFSFELMLIIACFTALWLWKMAKTAGIAVRVSELECELTAAKHQALKAQIKPHFVYNSLTAIQARYRTGLAEGDKAIEQFARHLRLVTDSDSEEMISFDDEVRNVLNYFELENLRADGKLSLWLDLNFTDFSVPVLSLQPLVENCIRHGGLGRINDGGIQLSSKKTDGGVIIEIKDNGVGFDTSAVSEGVGLENTRKRFELLGAQMSITSRQGEGTQVIIEIPLG